jgi:hypothetical protein
VNVVPVRDVLSMVSLLARRCSRVVLEFRQGVG